MTGQGPWEGHRGAVHARGDSPVETPGSQAREGVCASEMSVVLQFGVHKLTWLKIVQNIQSTREGVTAFLKKKGPDFFYKATNPVDSQKEVRNDWDAVGPQHPLHIRNLSRLGGVGAGRGVAVVNLRPRRTATRREGIFPSLLWTLTRPDLGQRFWVCNDGESRPDRLTN